VTRIHLWPGLVPALALVLTLLVGGCRATQEVVALEPGVYSLTSRGGTQRAMVDNGVAAAERHCVAMDRHMAPIATGLSAGGYAIRFRCVLSGDPALAGRDIVPLPSE